MASRKLRACAPVSGGMSLAGDGWLGLWLAGYVCSSVMRLLAMSVTMVYGWVTMWLVTAWLII